MANASINEVYTGIIFISVALAWEVHIIVLALMTAPTIAMLKVVMEMELGRQQLVLCILLSILLLSILLPDRGLQARARSAKQIPIRTVILILRYLRCKIIANKSINTLALMITAEVS